MGGKTLGAEFSAKLSNMISSLMNRLSVLRKHFQGKNRGPTFYKYKFKLFFTRIGSFHEPM